MRPIMAEAGNVGISTKIDFIVDQSFTLSPVTKPVVSGIYPFVVFPLFKSTYEVEYLKLSGVVPLYVTGPLK